jgi:integrase
LETSGRKDHRAGEPLSARTVRYCATILRAALQSAVDADLLPRNPADKADPPTAKQAKAPEMHAWRVDELRMFLDWTHGHRDRTAWLTLAHTGMRRGELLALRWRDVDLDAGTISVRRSVGAVRVKGQGERIIEGSTKTDRPRLVDLDAVNAAALRAHRRERGALSLALARPDALVFGDVFGKHLHPTRFSRRFTEAVARCRRELGDAAPAVIRLHDLRHTHATVLLAAGISVKMVSERLGHANATITLGVYAHVTQAMGRQAADTFAALLEPAPVPATAQES